jgi:hypothetical protein
VCVDKAMKEVELETLTAEEYDLVFLRWKAQVVLYDELQLYVEFSCHVCIILNSFV